MIRLSLLAALLTLAACSPPAHQAYAPDVERNFTRACESQSAVQGFCGCVWNKIETEVSPRDFAALEQLPGPQRAASPVMQRIEGYKRACLADTQREPQTAP